MLVKGTSGIVIVACHGIGYPYAFTDILVPNTADHVYVVFVYDGDY